MSKTLEYYLGLITSQFQDLPLYQKTLETLVQPLVDHQIVLESLIKAIDLDTAVGDQLDLLGEWVGIGRGLPVPLTGLYLEWDGASGVSFDSGRWQGSYDPDSGIVLMGDSEFRRLIRTKIRINQWDGTFNQLRDIWDSFLPDDRNGMIVDRYDMSISFGYEGGPLTGIDLAVTMVGINLLKPAGVEINSVFQAVDGSPLLIWDSSNGGWDTASWSSLILS